MSLGVIPHVHAVPSIPQALRSYASLDQAARAALQLPRHELHVAKEQVARDLAHTVAFLMVTIPPLVRYMLITSLQERYLRACKDASVDGGPHLIAALRDEHEGKLWS